jgi:hypothetical protein
VIGLNNMSSGIIETSFLCFEHNLNINSTRCNNSNKIDKNYLPPTENPSILEQLIILARRKFPPDE